MSACHVRWLGLTAFRTVLRRKQVSSASMTQGAGLLAGLATGRCAGCQPQCGCMVTQQAVRRLPRLSAASGSTSNGGGVGVQAAYGALLAKLSAELRAPAFTKLPAHLAAVTDPRRSSHFDSIRF